MKRVAWVMLATLWILPTSCKGVDGPAEGVEQVHKPSVEVAVATAGEVVRTGQYHGRIEARRQIVVSAEVAGRAQLVSVDEGDVVELGKLLVQLDEEPFRLAEQQAIHGRDAAAIRVEQAKTTLELEKKRLEAGFAQANAAVDAAKARHRLVEHGARPEEKGQLRAALQGAKAALDFAELELGRMRSLAKADVIPQQQLDTAEATWRRTQAAHNQATQAYRLAMNGAREEDLEVARSKLSQALAGVDAAQAAMDLVKVRQQELEAAKVALAQAELAIQNAAYQRSKVRLVATLEGNANAVVATRNIDPGEMVAPGVPLMTLLVLDRPKLVIQVAGEELPGFPAGARVAVRCAQDAEAVKEGRVLRVGLQANVTNATFPVQIELNNTAHDLREGLVCQAFPTVGKWQGTLVPAQAVYHSGNGTTLFVEKDGVVHKRSVTLAGVQEQTAVLTAGLAAGERVVLTSGQSLVDGQEVVVK